MGTASSRPAHGSFSHTHSHTHTHIVASRRLHRQSYRTTRTARLKDAQRGKEIQKRNLAATIHCTSPPASIRERASSSSSCFWSEPLFAIHSAYPCDEDPIIERLTWELIGLSYLKGSSLERDSAHLMRETHLLGDAPRGLHRGLARLAAAVEVLTRVIRALRLVGHGMHLGHL